MSATDGHVRWHGPTLAAIVDLPVSRPVKADVGEEVPGMSSDPTSEMAPGDQAPPGTPGTGENICQACGGSGTVDDADCTECAGTGTVVEQLGGA